MTEKMSLEQFIESYKDSYDENSSSDWELVTMKNPEDPNFKKDIHIHKSHLDRIKKLSKDLDIPVEEMVFMTFLSGIKDSDLLSDEGKQKVKEYLDRQKKKIESETEKELINSLHKVSVNQLKALLRLKGIKNIDSMEKEWRKEFKIGRVKINGIYDEDLYVKYKLAKEFASR